MKITFGGRYRVHELGDAIDRVFQNLLVNGVDEIQSVTVYLNLFREQRSLHLLDEEGGSIEHLKIDGPTSRRFEPISSGIHIAPRDPRS